jgi:hypothetical protein
MELFFKTGTFYLLFFGTFELPFTPIGWRTEQENNCRLYFGLQRDQTGRNRSQK